jgi:hypothetical protein
MAEWVTVYKEQNFTNAHLIKSFLEFEDIEVHLLDELTSQTGSIYFAASGGVRIQVQEPDIAKAMAILKEKGYGNPDVDKSNQLFNTLGKFTKKIPFLKKMRIEVAVFTLAAILVSSVLIIIFFLTKESTEEIIVNHRWQVIEIKHNNQIVKRVLTNTTRFISGPGPDRDKISFKEDYSIHLSDYGKGSAKAIWKIDGDRMTFKPYDRSSIHNSGDHIFFQTFQIFLEKKYMILESATTKITCLQTYYYQ